MSNDNHKRMIDVQQPLLEESNEKVPTTIIKNDIATKADNETNHTLKQKQMERKRTKSVAIIAEDNENKKMQKWKLVPPDGGWGWLVLVGSTLVNLLVPGTVKSFGVLFVEFLETFQASSAAAAWIPALCYFLYSPISSILSVKYSYRTVTIIGGTCAAAGMMISCFANSVAFLCLSYGVLVGTGAGLSFPPTVYIVTSYFVRLRGLANGICISGSALGSIILPPLLRVVLETYGYRGAILIMGGITLNVWVAALFYDPVDKHMKKVPIQAEEEDEELNPLKPKFVISTEDSMASLQHIPHNDSFPENMDFSSNNFNRSVSSAAMQSYKAPSRERKISMPTSRHELVRAKAGANMNSSSALHAVPESGPGTTVIDMQSQSRLTSSRRRTPKRSPSTSSFQYLSTPFHGSTLTLQPETFASSFSLKSIKKSDQEGQEAQPKKKFFDISLLKDPLYLVILISNATNAISYTNFIILLPSYAISLGYDKNMGALLLSINSAFDLIGRIGGSALSDLHLCPKAAYFIGGLFVSGISLSIMPFFTSNIMLCFFCATFGLASGTYVGITAVIMADMLGEERLQSSYGISLFVNGVIQLIGPPLCGLWFEATHTYVPLFCTLGVVLTCGSLLWGFVPFIKKKPAKEIDDLDDSS